MKDMMGYVDEYSDDDEDDDAEDNPLTTC